MEKELYPVATMARHPATGWWVGAFVVEATSKEEAVGIAAAVVRKVRPTKDGYFDYHCFAGNPGEALTPENAVLLP
jgi:hypothetical protein